MKDLSNRLLPVHFIFQCIRHLSFSLFFIDAKFQIISREISEPSKYVFESTIVFNVSAATRTIILCKM